MGILGKQNFLMQCGAKITQAYDANLKQWDGFTISMEEYANEIQLINIPPNRRAAMSAGNSAPVTAYEQTQMRQLSRQLSWLAQQCCPKLVAPLSLLMGETNCATVDTLMRLNKLARQSLKWASEPMVVHPHRNPVAVGWSDGGWTTRRDGALQLGCLVGIADAELLQGKESPVTVISWHSSKTPRVAKSSSAVELQGIGEVDDEMTYDPHRPH